MGLGGLVRNLGRVTENGTLSTRSESLNNLLQRLADVDGIRKARLHPVSVLSALLTYLNDQTLRRFNLKSDAKGSRFRFRKVIQMKSISWSKNIADGHVKLEHVSLEAPSDGRIGAPCFK